MVKKENFKTVNSIFVTTQGFLNSVNGCDRRGEKISGMREARFEPMTSQASVLAIAPQGETTTASTPLELKRNHSDFLTFLAKPLGPVGACKASDTRDCDLSAVTSFTGGGVQLLLAGRVDASPETRLRRRSRVK